LPTGTEKREKPNLTEVQQKWGGGGREKKDVVGNADSETCLKEQKKGRCREHVDVTLFSSRGTKEGKRKGKGAQKSKTHHRRKGKLRREQRGWRKQSAEATAKRISRTRSPQGNSKGEKEADNRGSDGSQGYTGPKLPSWQGREVWPKESFWLIDRKFSDKPSGGGKKT